MYIPKFGRDKINNNMASRRLSRLLSFTESKKTVDVSDEEISIARKESRRNSVWVSQLFGLVTEEEHLESGDDVLDSGKGGEIERQRTRRFSSLFTITTPESSDETFSLSGEGEENKTEEARREDIATMVFKLFRVRNSRQGSKPKRNVSTRSAASFKSKSRKAKEERIKATINIKPFWKHQKQAQHPTTIPKDAETLSLTPTVVRKAEKSKHRRSTSVCDSKFSSISFALSFTSLAQELIALTVEQCSVLLHLTRKIERSLKRQERLTSNFSTNLAHLFARKEKSIDLNKRLSKECRKMLISMMAGLRELVGRTFLKKAVFMHRSLELVRDLMVMLEKGPETRAQVLVEEASDSDETLVPSLQSHPELEQRMSITVEEVNASHTTIPIPEQEPVPEHQIDIHQFLHSLNVLKEDIGLQLQLDQALRAGIVGPCEDARFPATVNERIAMKRFVTFVDGCLMYLGKRYAEEGRVVRRLEVLGGLLKDESG
jgi:hypothetical protein